jgi:hypothetical protein
MNKIMLFVLALLLSGNNKINHLRASRKAG